MIIEDLLIEIETKKDSLKYINNYMINEMSEIFCLSKDEAKEVYNKIMGLLNGSQDIILALENVINQYQAIVNKNYEKLLDTENIELNI